MAYRRRQNKPSSTFQDFPEEEIRNPNPNLVLPSSSNEIDIDTSSSSLAAKAIRASSARRDSSLSSLYGHSNLSNALPTPNVPQPTPIPPKDSGSYEFTSMKSLNQPKNGFWGVLARKAKSIVEDDNVSRQSEMPATTRSHMPGGASRGKFHNSNHLEESNLKRDSPAFLKGLDAFTSSLNHIGGTIGKSLEEGFTIVESRTSDIIQETRKHIRKKPGNSVEQNQEINHSTTLQQSQLRTQMSPMQTDQDLQLKASRDVAMAMAAKAKLLLRELKTVKADLAFAKDRCAQLEEENKILRENRERGDSQDDDLIRLQLETLLAEKARLAHENSVYARENRFLREVVEYHQLTMQDVVYLDENSEEVTEVNPLNFPPVPTMSQESIITPSITSPPSPLEANSYMDSELTRGISSSISGKDAKSSEVRVKDSRSSEVTSISSTTGKGAE
ncbi:hypothetical protein TanjilG_01471 [Lupinus angustifolius]|uniref:Uncharacterized protein n=1 Tax=Lupinus angustifolius TaxID=3871 RepID=A0A4P1QVE2_LUPAN|nr:PREDICTED: uncharacterized protein LOC109330328 isoform X1 [Lupinus angustifolius]OIV95677.1 hypothetical protein TanjilG_01471 [Lupinus angustifolius]